MSFYRSLLAAVAAMGLAGAVFADDASTSATSTAPAADASAKMIQTADASSTAQAGAAATAPTDQTKVDINKATAKELMKVQGLTANKARAIVAYRKKHGDFKSTDDLKLVKGFKRMKDARFKQIEDQLTTG